MSEKKPTPVMVSGKKSRMCPVCGQRSYSLGGIHPQCAVLQADAPRTTLLAAERKAAAKMKIKTGIPPSSMWGKTCPRCRTQVPARRNVCECGHIFSAK